MRSSRRTAGTEHADRHLVARPAQRGDHAGPVEDRHVHVEHDGVGRRVRDYPQRHRPVRRGEDREAGQTEPRLKRGEHVRVVVHDQYGGGHLSMCPPTAAFPHLRHSSGRGRTRSARAIDGVGARTKASRSCGSTPSNSCCAVLARRCRTRRRRGGPRSVSRDDVGAPIGGMRIPAQVSGLLERIDQRGDLAVCCTARLREVALRHGRILEDAQQRAAGGAVVSPTSRVPDWRSDRRQVLHEDVRAAERVGGRRGGRSCRTRR